MKLLTIATETKLPSNLVEIYDRSKAKNTGCLTCLDSCPVGIISNSAYTNGAVENTKEVKFTGNQDVLPEDGTYVATVYSIAK